jgi:16S rRNA (guanine966-N2)-methyltransferase
MSLEPLTGLRVVDLFAGSGALGIEALSRGAEHVDFVERRRPALVVLRDNLAALHVEDRSEVWALDLPRGLKQLAPALAAADLILADPPYGDDLGRRCLVALGAPGVLSDAARVVIEHHAKDTLPEIVGNLRQVRTRRYGETQLTVYAGDRNDGGPDAE